MGRNKIVISIFLLLLALLTYMEARQPEPINWNPSYSATDKIPLGTYVLAHSLSDAFTMEVVSQPPYEFLADSSARGTYVFINDQLLFDDQELDRLLSWVAKGNTAFLAADAFSKSLLDTLKLNTATAVPSKGIASKPMLNLVHPELKGEEAFLFDHDTYHSVFSEMDSLEQRVLGISELYHDSLQIADPDVNFLKTAFGSGEIYMNTSPQAFSNFFILSGNNLDYVEGALGYLPRDQTLYWDAYYKSGKSFHTSPLYIFLDHQALKWAYYFLILGSVLFIIFEGKRKQRSIPVIPPLRNQSYEFARTLSDLYLERKDYKSIAHKKIQLFLAFIRNEYRLGTQRLDKEFYRSLAARTGHSEDEIRTLFDYIGDLQSKETLSKEDLKTLNTKIQEFKKTNNE